MAHILFAKETRRVSLVYIGWIQIAGFSFVSLRVDLKAYLQENVLKYFRYRSTIIRSVYKTERKAAERRAREFSEMNEDGYGDGSTKIRIFPRLAFSTSPGRRYHVAGSTLCLSLCISRQFNFRGKNKAISVISFFVTASLHLHWEIRTSEWASLGESRIDRARSTGVVNARHALTPSGCICIQQRKQRCWPPLVHRYAPLGSFSLNVDEGRRDGNRTFPLKRWRKGQSLLENLRGKKLSVQFTLTFNGRGGLYLKSYSFSWNKICYNSLLSLYSLS